MNKFFVLQMAGSNLRYGKGVTQEVGMVGLPFSYFVAYKTNADMNIYIDLIIMMIKIRMRLLIILEPW